MLKRSCLALTVALFIPSAVAFSSQTSQQMVSAAGVTADVSISQDWQHGGLRLDVLFESRNSPQVHTGCLSAYKDFSYELRDYAGRVVPADKSVLENPQPETFEAPSEWSTGKPIPCSVLDAPNVNRFAALYEIYPSVRPGTYTLYVIFEPRGTNQRAALTPLAIIVGNNGKLKLR